MKKHLPFTENTENHKLEITANNLTKEIRTTRISKDFLLTFFFLSIFIFEIMLSVIQHMIHNQGCTFESPETFLKKHWWGGSPLVILIQWV